MAMNTTQSQELANAARHGYFKSKRSFEYHVQKLEPEKWSKDVKDYFTEYFQARKAMRLPESIENPEELEMARSFQSFDQLGKAVPDRGTPQTVATYDRRGG